MILDFKHYQTPIYIFQQSTKFTLMVKRSVRKENQPQQINYDLF